MRASLRRAHRVDGSSRGQVEESIHRGSELLHVKRLQYDAVDARIVVSVHVLSSCVGRQRDDGDGRETVLLLVCSQLAGRSRPVGLLHHLVEEDELTIEVNFLELGEDFAPVG
jgi:hypothetical protein